MVSGNDHVKQWTTTKTTGEQVVHEVRTPQQPQVFEVHRKNMMCVDIHNRLRQGEGSMAEAWRIVSCKNEEAPILGALGLHRG